MAVEIFALWEQSIIKEIRLDGLLQKVRSDLQLHFRPSYALNLKPDGQKLKQKIAKDVLI